MRAMKPWKPVLAALRPLLTVLLLLLIFRSVGVSRIIHDLGNFHAKDLILILSVCWAGQLICSQRWRIIAASLGIGGTYPGFVRMYFVGMFFNIGLPSLVGGDIVKALLVTRRNGKPLQTGLVSVLQDRMAGLVSLLGLGTVAIGLCPISWKGIPLRSVYFAAWIVLILVFWIILKGIRLYSKLLIPDRQTILQRILQSLADFHTRLATARFTKRAAWQVVLYSLFYSGLTLWAFRQVTVAAGNPVNVFAFSALFPLVTIFTMVPVTLNGLGVREWIYVEALSLAGVPKDSGLAISLATSAIFLLCNLAGLLFLPGVPRELRLLENREAKRSNSFAE
jgi:glycosyltransferase 2 family protein